MKYVVQIRESHSPITNVCNFVQDRIRVKEETPIAKSNTSKKGNSTSHPGKDA
jgi:hypothetical protein